MATQFSVKCVLVVLFMSVTHRKISTEADDFKLEEPAIYNIQDELGLLFDCVDIYKQPAFKHPLLKNHKIQMTPSLSAQGQQRERSKPTVKYVNCPEGTVPIRRTRKEDLLRAKHVTELRPTAIHPPDAEKPGEYVAVIHLKDNTIPKFRGTEATMNAINPRVDVDQSSHALIRLVSGSNQIVAGWAVDQKLYGDSNTHFTVYWRGDKSGCFNLNCPGFVQVNKNIPLGAPISAASIYKGDSREMKVTIHQDPKTRNWWLAYMSVDLGYWPGFLFLDLIDGASNVEYGGLARGPTTKPSPPMGFGTFPPGGFSTTGYFVDIQILDNNYKWTSPSKGDFVEHSDSPQCYGVKQYGWDRSNGFNMEYGGPGGYC